MAYSDYIKKRFQDIKAEKGWLYWPWRVWMWLVMLPDEVLLRLQIVAMRLRVKGASE